MVLVGPGTPASLLAKYLITCSIIINSKDWDWKEYNRYYSNKCPFMFFALPNAIFYGRYPIRFPVSYPPTPLSEEQRPLTTSFSLQLISIRKIVSHTSITEISINLFMQYTISWQRQYNNDNDNTEMKITVTKMVTIKMKMLSFS